jgi:hypothetical protein
METTQKVNGKVKMLNYETRYEDAWGSGGTVPRILNIDSRWKCMHSFKPGCFTPVETALGTH